MAGVPIFRSRVSAIGDLVQVLRFRCGCGSRTWMPASGRAAIAMAAVRHDTRGPPGTVFDHSIVRPPTDVMAITSLPKTAKQNSKGNRRPDDWLGGSFQVAGGGPGWQVAGILPQSSILPIRQPLAASRYHLLLQNSFAIGLPPSVIGTGRPPAMRSLEVSTCIAARIVAWKSGTLTGSLTTVLENSSVSP